MNSIAKTLNFKKYTIYDTNDVLKFDYDVMFRSLLRNAFESESMHYYYSDVNLETTYFEFLEFLNNKILSPCKVLHYCKILSKIWLS